MLCQKRRDPDCGGGEIMQDLTITIIQTELFWEDIPANLDRMEQKIDGIVEATDLIILPEMWTTGFTLNAEKLAETMNGASVSWMAAKARQKSAHLLGSIIIKEEGKYFNRLIWAKPDGEILTYDKKHLFRMADEHKVYAAGNRHLSVEVKGWKLQTFICYDLRFPVWCRNQQNQYDVAIFIANWPARRASHWKLLLQARAVENQAYVLGVNRVGKDGNDLDYSGDSTLVEPQGNILFAAAQIPCVFTAKLDYNRISEFRESFTAWMDADATGGQG